MVVLAGSEHPLPYDTRRRETHGGLLSGAAGLHALTVDLEDWHQLVHRRFTGKTITPTPAVVTATCHLLDFLDETDVRATFFVLGNVATEYPELIREVGARGHEIGSHTHSHPLIFQLGREQFRREMERSVKGLQDITGREVTGFRAPEFSVQRLDHWCFEILAGLGFRYDSSVFPVPGARYGIPDAPQTPFDICTPAGKLREYPLATWDVGRFRLPLAGGSYFRLLPERVLQKGMREIARSGRTAVLYVHPYEFHRGLLAPIRSGWRRVSARRLPFALSRVALHNLRTAAVAERIRTLTSEFRFVTLSEIYEKERCVSHPANAVS